MLITIASVGFCTRATIGNLDWYSSLFNMIAIDVLVGAICTLVFVLNELWSDKSKTRLVYHQMPSDAVFSDIASGKIDATGFDLETAQKMYGHMADAPANLQTAEWNKLLQKSRISEMGNVIEAERLQLMTRDICMSTISLFIMTLAALVVLEVFSVNKWDPIKMFIIPLVYLLVMFFASRAAARSRGQTICCNSYKKRCAKRHLRFRHHSFGKQSSNINCFSADGSAKAVLNGCKFVASWF